MAKQNRKQNATPRNTAPVLVLGTSVAQALAQPTVPAMPAPVPGSLAATAATLAANPATAGHPMVTMGVNPQVANTIVHPTQVVVKLGKPYNVRSGTQFDNVRSWQATCAFLQANGGSCTVGALADHLKSLYNHANFAGYAVRRGYLQPVA